MDKPTSSSGTGRAISFPHSFVNHKNILSHPVDGIVVCPVIIIHTRRSVATEGVASAPAEVAKLSYFEWMKII